MTDPGGAPLLLVTQWRSATFAFGEAGSPATYTMDDVEDTRALDYVYESTALPEDLAAAVEERRGTVRAGREMTADDTKPGYGGDKGFQLVADWVDCIQTGRRDVRCGIEPMLATLQLIDAIYQSSREGRRIECRIGPA